MPDDGGLVQAQQNYMSKRKFIATSRNHFEIRQGHQRNSQELRNQKKATEGHQNLFLPTEGNSKKTSLQGKPLRSEGKTSQRSSKHHAFELMNLKQSLLLKHPRQSFTIKSITKKRISTNRMVTEKVVHPSRSADKKNSINKIIIRGGGYSKELSPDRNTYLNLIIEKLPHPQTTTEPQGPIVFEGPRKSIDKKLTAFEREESKGYQIYFIGNRRVSGLSDFTDSEGDPKISIGDAVAYKYEIVSVLGRGSFGRVFKAFDHKKKEYIALKVIKNQEKFNNQAKVQIQILETAIMHDPKLRNNIIRLKGSFVFRGHTCLKFQILNKNLYEFIKESNFSGFSLDLIRRFAIQILQALHFFSKHRIIHCDLKPENILLKEENKSGIKVIDVGSGCFDGKQIYTYIQSRFYRAPEIILGIKYTTAIDMWSLGCILVELYTGVPVFPGQNQNEQMHMFIQLLGMPPIHLLHKAERKRKFFNDEGELKIPPSKNKDKLKKCMNWRNILGSDCDKSFVSLVKRCLQWDPELRMTAKDALLHEWIISGLPHTIRNQHVEQLSEQ